MVVNLDNKDELEATDILVRFYNVDNPIIISIIQTDSVSAKSFSSNFLNDSEKKSTDIWAVVTFATALIGFMYLPLLFVPICFISSIISYYRLKDNQNLTGKGLRLTGAIINSINILYLMYTFDLGPFNPNN
ncbi:MAG: hypothetical protein RSC72_15400 [Algoriella sp.]|uniref:hypothetical protein n=1 Tax=Algoriella sp. TaxID=1872434 RepID=UPI002FCC5457